jgi:hypothetical protein
MKIILILICKYKKINFLIKKKEGQEHQDYGRGDSNR